MPPIKSRMMGLAAKPKDSDFNSIKATLQTGIAHYRKRGLDIETGVTVIPDEEADPLITVSSPKKSKVASPILRKDKDLMKLRIPMELCCTLPSVRRFHAKGQVPKMQKAGMTHEMVVIEDEEEAKGNGSSEILGLKRRGGKLPHYHLRLDAAHKFNYMIWDIAFLPPDSIVLSTTNGVFICDADTLKERMQLAEVPLGGGISFLADGQIVIVDRNGDRINMYTREGEYVRSFPAGESPTNVAVNSKDEIIVTDIGEKCVRMFHADGTQIRVIETVGTGYQFRWPLYLNVVDQDKFIVADAHLQVIMMFDYKGRYIRNLPLRTICGNEVLRPHGICVTNRNDLLVIDHAVNSIEVFTTEGHYIQTLIPSETGGQLRPKVMRVSPDGKQLLIGGLMGAVNVFSFVSAEEALAAELAIKSEIKQEVFEDIPKFKITKIVTPMKQKGKHFSKVKIKAELKIKEEPSNVCVKQTSDVIVID